MKLKTQLFTFMAMATILLASCAPVAEAPKSMDLDALKVEIQKMEDAFAAAEKVKDADAVASYYSEDAISYGRNDAPTVGRAAIKEKIAKKMSTDTSGNYNVYKIVDLFAEGNTIVEIGTWTVLSPAGAEVGKGHYMSYFQKRDGKYLCVRDMNASSKPEKEGM
ncbi:MAG: nuclear transport factor 2 family protein [Bacteroidota bacterium]|nr:nuclear transport factor 2 family protein [Bacteroidota bacterium]